MDRAGLQNLAEWVRLLHPVPKAGEAHVVEQQPSKLTVASSNLVARSNLHIKKS